MMGKERKRRRQSEEIATLRQELARLEEELHKRRQHSVETAASGIKSSEHISSAQIEQFVQEMLADPDVNSDWLWDPVEQRIYTNVFNIVLRVLDQILETTSVEFLGHKMKFTINPIVSKQFISDTVKKTRELDIGVEAKSKDCESPRDYDPDMVSNGEGLEWGDELM